MKKYGRMEKKLMNHHKQNVTPEAKMSVDVLITLPSTTFMIV